MMFLQSKLHKDDLIQKSHLDCRQVKVHPVLVVYKSNEACVPLTDLVLEGEHSNTVYLLDCIANVRVVYGLRVRTG